MQTMPAGLPQPNVVMTIFQDGAAFFFQLPSGATLGELADRMGALDERRHGTPILVSVKLRS